MSHRVPEVKVENPYAQWKLLIPVLYDWFANHNLIWPSLSCRWGPQVKQEAYNNFQRLYFAEQTDGRDPNTLVVATVQVVKPRVAAAQFISQFDDDARAPYIKKHKTILHPGEVNRIRELPQNSNILATHTDSPNVFIWNVKSQPNRACVFGAKPSRPDLILTGHQDVAEYALAMCPTEPFVLSGGRDRRVLLWSIHDHISSSAADQGAQQSTGSKGGAVSNRPVYGSTLKARGIFRGHNNTIEDVQFHPSSAQEFCSVGNDSCLILWDARTGALPVVKVEKAHKADIHCVDWNPNDSNLILTGSADNTICVFDRRNLTSRGVGSAIHTFKGHSATVQCVQWCPYKASMLGSAAEDGILNIWDLRKIGDPEIQIGDRKIPPGLFFQHTGHRGKVVDFHWNAVEPWTLVSVSDDVEKIGGGGTIQIWRVTDMLTRQAEDVIEELEKFKDHILPCCSSSTS